MKRTVTIIDYGMGNIWSVKSALEYLGCAVIITDDNAVIKDSKYLVLPGVGSFRKAMVSLCNSKLDKAILDATIKNKSKILGICLGMQLMGTKSSEDGETDGLGLIPKTVEKFKESNQKIYKIPHIGFNSVKSEPNSILFKGLADQSDFYFVHSYRMLSDGDGIEATAINGEVFLAAYEKDNIFATQFHPEKSQTNGLALLKNFLC